ncbi:MAG: YceI family protein [Leptospiraceae bacterium]|nr:YceI family protein [Leptospiraceae bacterium]
MKNIFFILSLLIAFSNCEKAPEAPKAEVKEEVKQVEAPKVTGTPVTLDLKKSLIKWIGTKVTGKHTGTIGLSSGEILVNNDKVVGGNFTLDMKTIEVTDLKGKDKKKLEGHLMTTDFFEVEKFPTGTFTISKVEEVKDGEATITGELVLKEIKKTISFPAKITYNAEKKPVAAAANFNINRKLWNINYEGQADNLISNDVNLDLNLAIASEVAPKK